MVAARAFLKERKPNMPVSVVVFGPDETVLAEFTTDGEELAAAVANAPATSEGTHIYDALIEATEAVTDQGLRRATIVLLSDGTDVGSEASLAEAQQALAATSTRVYSVGLRSPQYAPDSLQSVSRRSGGRYAEAAQPAELAAIFTEIGSGSRLRVRGDVPLRAPTAGEGRRPGRRGRSPRGEGELYDSARSRSPPEARSTAPGSTR